MDHSSSLNDSTHFHLFQIGLKMSLIIFAQHVLVPVFSGTCLLPQHAALVMVLDKGALEPIKIAKMHLLWRIYAVKWDNRG